MFQSISTAVGITAAFAACGTALFRGGAPERAAGARYCLAWLVSPHVQVADPQEPEWGVLAVDVAVALGFLAILSWRPRLWLAAALAFQLLAVATHVAMLVDRRITMNTYLIGLAMWSIGALIAIFVGAITARKTEA